MAKYFTIDQKKRKAAVAIVRHGNGVDVEMPLHDAVWSSNLDVVRMVEQAYFGS